LCPKILEFLDSGQYVFYVIIHIRTDKVQYILERIIASYPYYKYYQIYVITEIV
jgi:hypothetical protein